MSAPQSDAPDRSAADTAAVKDTAANDSGKPGKKPRKKRGFLRRWTRRLVIWGFVLAVVLRVALMIAMPWLVDFGAGFAGYRAEYDSLRLSLLTGELQLWDLRLTPIDADPDDPQPHGEPPLRLEYLTADLDVTDLFTGLIRVRRVEVDGLDIVARRDAEGRIDLIENLPKPDPDAEPEPAPEPEPAAEESALPLELPLQVDAIRFQRLQLTLHDEASTPAVDAVFDVDVRLSHLGDPERQGRLEIVATSPQALDVFQVESRFSTGPRQLDAWFDVTLAGLHTAPLRGWLESFGIRPVAARLDAGVRIEAGISPSADDELSADLELVVLGAHVQADGVTAARLDEFRIEGSGLTTARATLDRLLLAGAEALAEGRPDGALRVAGLDLLPSTAAEPPTPHPPAPQPAAPQPAAPQPAGAATNPATASGPGFQLFAAGIEFRDAKATFRDATQSPPVDLQAAVDSVTVTLDRNRPLGLEMQAGIRAELRVPGVIETLTATGDIRPRGARTQADFEVALRGIRPELLRPYLQQAGLESTYEAGDLSLKLSADVAMTDAGIEASAALTELQLTDGDELFGLDRVAIEALALGADGSIGIDTVELRGLRLPVRRRADRQLALLGLRTSPSAAPRPVATAAPGEGAAAPDAAAPDEAAPGTAGVDRAASPTAASTLLPPIRLGRLVCRDATVQIHDDAAPQPLDLQLGPVELTLSDLQLGGPPSDEPVEHQAPLELRTRVGDLARELAVLGTITTRPGPLWVRAGLDITGTALSLEAVRSQLEELGLEPALQNGRLAARLEAEVQDDAGTLRAALRVADVSLQHTGGELLGLRELRVDGVAIAPGADLQIAAVRLDGPSLALARDADGGLLAAGLRVPPPTPPAPAATEPAATEPAAAQTPAEPPPAPTAEPVPQPAQPAAPGSGLRLEQFAITNAELRWNDAALAEPLATALQVALQLDGIAVGMADAPPTRFDVTITVPDTLDEARINGDVALGDGLRASLAVATRGLRAGPLAAYLPPGLEAPLADGRLQLKTTFEMRTGADGATSLTADFGELSFRDGEGGAPLLALASARVVAPRLTDDQVLVDEVVVEGFEIETVRSEAGLELLGLRILPPPAPTAAARPAREPAADPSAPRDRATAAAARETAGHLPRVELRRLDLGIARLRLQDTTSPDAQPLEASLRLTNPEPLVLLDEHPEDLAPVHLQVRGAAQPVIDALTADLICDPWDVEPSLVLDFAADGLHGAGITAVIPDLAEQIDGSGLDGGRFAGKLDLRMRVRRRDPLHIDLAAGFGAEANLSNVAFQATPDGEVLAGVGLVYVDVARVTANGSVHIRRIEVSDIVGRASRDDTGTHLLGLTLKPAPETSPAPATEPVAAGPEPQPAAQPAEPAAATGAEVDPPPTIRLDELLVSGLDLRVEDHTGPHPAILPITGFDLELRNLHLGEPDPPPMSFALYATAGDIDLPEHKRASSLVAGVVGATGRLVTGGGNTAKLEPRPLFTDLAVQGSMTPTANPVGRVRANLTGFELLAVRGPAAASSVQIGDGTFDFSMDLRAEPSEAKLKSTATFEYLELSEPEGGPISSWLKLPAPLQTVLFVLRNDRGQQVIPLNITVAERGLSSGQIASLITSTLTSVITDAVISSPFRVTGAVTDLIGVTGGPEAALPDFVVEFEAASTALRRSQRDIIAKVVKLLESDDELVVELAAELSSADWERVEILANPSDRDARALAVRLRQTLRELRRRHAEQAAEARTLYAIGDLERATESSAQLRDLDREIGSIDRSLQALLSNLRRGADRRRDQRTAQAASGLARQRLTSLHRLFLEQMGDDQRTADRIELRAGRPRPDTACEGEGKVLITVIRRATR